jgi:hypothetical protein
MLNHARVDNPTTVLSETDNSDDEMFLNDDDDDNSSMSMNSFDESDEH